MKCMALSAAILAATLGTAQAATVFFDDFEANGLGTPNVNLTQNVANWTVTTGTVDVIGTDYFQWYGTGRYLDMNGSSGAPGRIEQTIGGLTAGKKYTLSFNYGYNQNSGSNEQLSFGIGNLAGALNPADFALVLGTTFNLATYTFKATGSTQSLFFADTGATTGDNGGPILDNVRVDVAPIPLPAAAPLLIAGLGALAMVRRRRRT